MNRLRDKRTRFLNWKKTFHALRTTGLGGGPYMDNTLSKKRPPEREGRLSSAKKRTLFGKKLEVDK